MAYRRCPICQSNKQVIPIMYGMPASDPGPGVHIGGCCITENDPTLHCKKCGTDFARPKAEVVVERPKNRAAVRIRFESGTKARREEEQPSKPVRAWFIRYLDEPGPDGLKYAKEREMTLEEAQTAPEHMTEQECQCIIVEFSNGDVARPYRFVDCFYE